MAIPATKVILKAVDEAEDFALAAIYLAGLNNDPAGVLPQGFRTAMKACSVAAFTRTTCVPADMTLGSVAGVTPYRGVSDRVRMMFVGSTTGKKHLFDFPCPKAAIFAASGTGKNEAVDPDQPDVAALVTWMETNAKGSGSEALTFVRGWRIRNARHKKW